MSKSTATNYSTELFVGVSRIELKQSHVSVVCWLFRKDLCDGVFEKISETRSEAVEAMNRLAQRSGAVAGLHAVPQCL